MKAIIHLILLISIGINAQTFDMTADFDRFFLGDGTVELGFSPGNSCDSPVYMTAIYNGDMDMNSQNLELMHVHVIVQGNLINEGTIVYRCDSSILEVLGGTLGTDDHKKEFKVWPNPFTDFINVNGEVQKLELFDVLGRKLKDYQTFGSRHSILTDSLATGLYFLRINDIKTIKLIKK